MKKKIIILGATGSIGTITTNIIFKNKKNFKVVLLTAYNNYKKLFSQAKKIDCNNVVIFDKENFKKAKKFNINRNIKIFNSIKDFLKINKYKVDYSMCAISGLSGLESIIEIIKVTKNYNLSSENYWTKD